MSKSQLSSASDSKTHSRPGTNSTAAFENNNTSGFSDLLQSLSGPVEFPLLNDVVFHLAMNRSPMVSLRGLLSDLLEIPFDEITHVEILNPITQQGPLAKESILDVLTEINHSRIINIELQTWHDTEWINRSVYYLCQEYSNINRGEHYYEIKAAMHVCIMTYTLFPAVPEFYARYRLLNIENNNLYTPNFALNVLDLSKDYLATERDRDNHLDYWASLFKCTTWEEVRSLASRGPVFKEVAESMAISNLEPKEVSMARYHNRYVSGMHGSFLAGQESRQQEIDEANKRINTLNDENTALSDEISALSDKNTALETRIKELEALLAAMKAT